MMASKRRIIHGFSLTRKVGLLRQTACNSFFAEGYWAMPSSENDAEVTCKACLKNMAKEGRIIANN